MNPSLDGPRAKIERAKAHLRNLDAEVGAFMDLNPYSVVYGDAAANERARS